MVHYRCEWSRLVLQRPGAYFLRSRTDLGLAGAVVTVKQEIPNGKVVVRNLPSDATLLVQSAAGTLRGPDFYPARSQPPRSLSLVDARSGRIVSKTQADVKGFFSLQGAAAPVVYFIRFNPSGLKDVDGYEMEGDFPVEIDPHADWATLDGGLSWTSYGLGFLPSQP